MPKGKTRYIRKYFNILYKITQLITEDLNNQSRIS